MPDTMNIGGNTFTVNKSFGHNPYEQFAAPMVNITTVVDGVQHYRSADDFTSIDDSGIYSTDIRRTLLRFKIAATDVIAECSETLQFTSGVSTYELSSTPVRKIVSIGAFTEGVDYRLDNRSVIEWIGSTPDDAAEFTVVYEAHFNSYWLANDMTDRLRMHLMANLEHALKGTGVRVQGVSDSVDISMTFADDNISAFAFDVTAVYPWSWKRELTEEDGPLIDNVNVTVEEK